MTTAKSTNSLFSMAKKERKICLVIPSLQSGGMERVMSELAGYFSTKPELEIHLVLYGISPVVFYQIPDTITIHKPGFTFNNRYRLYYTLKTLFYLRKEIIRINPDTILSFGELWNSFVLLALLGLKIPVYISDRCSPAKKFNTFHAFLRRWLYPNAAGIIAQTNKAQEIFSMLLRHSNIAVIGNPIRKIENSETIKRENIILTVGRLINTKHHDRLVKIFSQLNAPEWKLIIIGGNALKQNNQTSLSKLVEDLGMKDRIVFTGEITDIDIYYRKSKIFAFTSSSEGLPNVVGEALSAGLPVVSYDCIAGPSEMITDGENGFLIPVFDDDLFLKRLQMLVDDEALRQRMSAQAAVSIEKYSLEKIGQQYLDLILS